MSSGIAIASPVGIKADLFGPISIGFSKNASRSTPEDPVVL